jgi:hypothetical protein
VARRLKRLALVMAAGALLVAAANGRVRLDTWDEAALGPLDLSRTWRVYPFTPSMSLKEAPALVLDDGRRALRLATADEPLRVGRALKVNLAQTPWLTWEWKALVLPEGGDVRRPKRNDQAARVMVMFEGMKGLLYVWDTTAPAGTEVRPDEFDIFDRALIVVRSGTGDLGRWVRERRNVLVDFRRVFGEDPLSVKWVGLESHSNDTHTRSAALFGAAAFEPR